MIDELPEMVGWMEGRKLLFDLFVSNLFFFWKFHVFIRMQIQTVTTVGTRVVRDFPNPLSRKFDENHGFSLF